MKKVLLLLLLATSVFAQTTVKDALLKHWKTSGEFTAKGIQPPKYTF